jgi:hypothetical protein
VLSSANNLNAFAANRLTLFSGAHAIKQFNHALLTVRLVSVLNAAQGFTSMPLGDVLKFLTIVTESTSTVFALNVLQDLSCQMACVSEKLTTVLRTIRQTTFADSAVQDSVSLMANASDCLKIVLLSILKKSVSTAFQVTLFKTESAT